MIYLQLFWEYFKAGLFAVGGGMATIPFLYEISDRTGWFTHQDLANMLAVSESTPGPIGVNMATYVGFVTGIKEGGIPNAILGAVTASIGLVLPSLIVILIVAAMLKRFKESPLVQKTFYGLRPASTGLIAAAGLSVAVANLVDSSSLGINWKGCILAVVLWLLTNKVKQTKKLHPIVFIGFSALVGIVFSMG
ncbi:MAG: chromate transporter [Oscillospiraceae bacterium]|nr:chromate transporter [Oscillospiraceae bacterium]